VSGLDRGEPWWVEWAVEWLDRFAPWERVFEWGSGASTIWLAERASEVYGVEHDSGWVELVNGRLEELGMGHAVVEHHSLHGADYSRAILNHPDSYFDLVAIDGRKRVACATSALNKVKPGGMIVLDDSERYMQIFGLLEGWTRAEFYKGPHAGHKDGWGTTIWLRPSK